MNPEEELGQRVRRFRGHRRMSVRALAERAGTSPSFISQLENARTNASIATLRRIADALGISLPDLLDPAVDPGHRLLRRADRPRLPTEAGVRKYVLSQPPLRHVEVYCGEFAPGASTGALAYTHGDAQEIFVVLAGTITLTLGDTEHVLNAGDSIEYDSSTPHRAVNHGDRDAEVLWITSPPTVDGVR